MLPIVERVMAPAEIEAAFDARVATVGRYYVAEVRAAEAERKQRFAAWNLGHGKSERGENG